MDKYEYKVRLQEIKDLIAKGEYVEAASIADTIDWTRVKSVMMLCTISDLYKINRRLEDARDLLLLAYDRYPGGRSIVYSLCELFIKMGDVVQAVEYYKEFVQIAPKDTGRYILQYKLYEAQDVSIEERIEVLKELKSKEYIEKWAYELAYLYHRIGLATKCVEECDELILWFGEGRYVMKAMELKMLHEPLTPSQEEKYAEMKGEIVRQKAAEEAGEVYPEAPEEEKPEEEVDESPTKEILTSDPDDIQVKVMNVGQYDTINMQKELAANMKELWDQKTDKEPDADLVAKKEKYNTEPVYSHQVWRRYASPVWMDIRQSNTLNRTAARDEKDERHICPLQLDLIARCLELWTNPNDIVLDPFAGIGSVPVVALQMGRRAMGFELKESYFKQAVLNCQKEENHDDSNI